MGDSLIKLLHFEKLKPLCPVCRKVGQEYFLEISTELKQGKDTILEGILVCTNPQCLSEYPIIDGIPVIVADLRSYISQNVIPILYRSDLTDSMESLIGDCIGPGSAFDSQRQHISTYAFDHYGNLDPETPTASSAKPGSITRLLNRGLEAAAPWGPGPVIDIGCAVGRTSFELAKVFEEIVLGVDLNFGMLKIAAVILEKGRVSYPKRSIGISFERRDFSVAFEKAKNVDFWVCDALALPFTQERFSFAVSLNTLDCVWSPYEHLKELARILTPSGGGIVTTPYDWTANATPVESWLGGHSQRSKHKGSSEHVLRSLFTDGGHPNAVEELELVHEQDIPWTLRLHNRSYMEYMVHMITVQKKSVV